MEAPPAGVTIHLSHPSHRLLEAIVLFKLLLASKPRVQDHMSMLATGMGPRSNSYKPNEVRLYATSSRKYQSAH